MIQKQVRYGVEKTRFYQFLKWSRLTNKPVGILVTIKNRFAEGTGDIKMINTTPLMSAIGLTKSK